jgi:flagellar biosynthesis protein FliQ
MARWALDFTLDFAPEVMLVMLVYVFLARWYTTRTLS